MGDLAGLIRKVERYQAARASAIRLARAFESRANKLTNEVGRAEYGEIGSEVLYCGFCGVPSKAKILRFQPSLWSAIPLCILATIWQGKEIEVSITSGASLVRDGLTK